MLKLKRWLRRVLLLAGAIVSALGTLLLLGLLVLLPADGDLPVSAGLAPVRNRFEQHLNHVTADALADVLSTRKVYWLQDSDPVAPKPNPNNYGETADPAELTAVLEAAAELLDGQETLFQPDVEIREGSTVTWYLDETILCITWQHMEGNAVYTCSEVKIAHPSQFRRFLAGGRFGSGKRYKATEMAADVHAVTASNGDYYAFRGVGNMIYNGEVCLTGGWDLDTCHVDENGDLIFVERGQLYRRNELEAFAREQNIRFSLTFGPILIEDGEVTAKYHYALGENDSLYSRAALCQMGPLHYMLVTLNYKGRNVLDFARHLQELGVPRAYALDGGQTSTIVTGDRLMNPVDYGGERTTSDIIYFATAVPDGD